ncbi:hypothetical protein GCM10017764_28030 [Sphingobacterium griseoflavum]|uniref:Tetratricopeptide repeat protein n=2 Tax=Sphingobacterium griseoflavum TaxID=1474952 RepID=A0ABQ3I038_9SPHI|nr:hypothetical protein GCM10017764_28030 [Sphingobacterium griseoflavum]
MMLEQETNAIFHALEKNYQIRLSVFDEPTTSGDPHKMMDSLIQKAYKIVNDKQASKYVNDAIFLIGKAYYYKGAYYTAAAFFDKLIRDRRPEQKSFGALAYAWKSRALLQLGKEEAAGLAVDSAFMVLDDHAKTKTFVYAAKANHLVRIGKEQEAIPFLAYALSTNGRHGDRYRWKFLLAQLYRDTENEKALVLFNQLSRSNVPFDMAFEAGLQSAFLTQSKDTTNLAQRAKPFFKMLKEGKNDGYRDQILFEIGKIYLAGGEEEHAVRYFNKALKDVDSNPYQQTETFLVMADYFFSKKQYQKAQRYYDSIATILPQNYTDVNKLRRKLAFMKELTALYQENMWQDTLIALGEMPDNVRLAVVDSLAKQSLTARELFIVQQKKRNGGTKKESSTNRNAWSSLQGAAPAQQPASIFADSRFYFNNQDARLLGLSAFKKRWGGRQLKDGWRFSGDPDGQAMETQPFLTNDSDAVEQVLQVAGQDSLQQFRQRYLDAIPITAEDFGNSRRKIHDNMIAIGNIYRDYIRNNAQAIEAYEALLKRFPDTEVASEIYYALFRMYDSVDQVKSAYYKEKLTDRYPGSIHAMVAKDPHYMEKRNREKSTMDRAFERLFTLYTNGEHTAVIEQATEVLAGTSRASQMASQVAYLKALSIGRVGRVEDFMGALQEIIEHYPADSLVVPLAREHKRYMVHHPELFANRVNALQDKDKQRVAFVDEPDMTPWPALRINGDYRTASPLASSYKDQLAEQKAAEPQDGAIKKEVAVLWAEERKEASPKITTESIAGRKAGLSAVNAGILSSNLVSSRIDSINMEEERSSVRLDASATGAPIKTTSKFDNVGSLQGKITNTGQMRIDFGANDYRDKKLFPDTATYYFVVNVMDPAVNLAPSRYGIGQFNRSRYARSTISHQLSLVNAENQLLCMGPFETFEEVKTYETRILPLLPEIMKVPQEDYNSFIITREAIGTLTDGIQIKNYHQVYEEQ